MAPVIQANWMIFCLRILCWPEMWWRPCSPERYWQQAQKQLYQQQSQVSRLPVQHSRRMVFWSPARLQQQPQLAEVRWQQLEPWEPLVKPP